MPLSVKRENFNTGTVYSSTSSVNYNTYDPTMRVQDVTSKKINYIKHRILKGRIQ